MSKTPGHSRKSCLGVTPSPMPFYTPRPERRCLEFRGFDVNTNRHEKESEVNVQVVLRCRPLNDDEQRLNVPKVLTCNEHKREVIVANKQVDRVFTFDKVFGPKAQQRTIYDQSISPIVNEVLEGFNCTVFAYGQTGTGKTYTMEGGMRSKNGDLPADAGVIPRAVRQIFDTLEAQNADYSMKVTFLELYNEEITDLLANEENPRVSEEKLRKPISLMEDGKGCVIVRGLEEEAVYSANEIYNLLERGAAKRRTADTLLNKRSSRSHSIFSITIHVKEASIGDEDIIKCGKLNLVDLAGSENISRSGAREGRAREAGEINKSLLTLGRVINTLVEHSAHIPYRDSKLTRLLRDSLGGKTKTCIIATVSTSAQSLEETLSTLDYAYRAKNIKNKPEANQKMSKAVLLKDLYLEIEKMKQDVRAAREKNGVYIPHERFSQDEAEKKAKNEKIEQLEIDLSFSKKEVDQFRELYLSEQKDRLELHSELKCCKISLEKSNQALDHLQEKHRVAVSTLKEREFIISKLLHSENSLINRAKAMRTNLQSATDDISSLFTKLDHKKELESENHGMLLTFGSHLDQSLKDLHKVVLASVAQQQQQIVSMEEHITSFFASKYDATRQLESRITKMRKAYNSGLTTLKDIADVLQTTASTDLEEIKSTMACQITTLENLLRKAALEAKDVTCDLQNTLNEQKQILEFSAQQQLEGLHRSMISTEVISRATFNFYNDLNCRSSELMRLLEEIQITKTHQLQTFEKVFKEEAVREEKQAMEKIAEILASLTYKRTAQVSETTKNIEDSTIRENKMLLQRLSSMQQVTSDANEKMNIYLDTSKEKFLEDTFASSENLVTMESCLDECIKTVNHSMQQWDNMQFSIQNHNQRNIAEIASIVKKKVHLSENIHQQFVSTTSSINENVGAEARETLEAVNDSLMLDQQAEREIESISALCSDELKCLKGKHSESIANIRNKAEECLTKHFLIDTHPIPKKNMIEIPSLKSIEEMRTPAVEELIQQQKSKSGSAEKLKVIQHQKSIVEISPNRTPFADVN